MQMAVVEAARNLAGIQGAGSTEFGQCQNPIVGLLTEWDRDGVVETRSEDSDMGGSMRLGAYDANLTGDSRIRQIYSSDGISERHRHRFEFNNKYRQVFSENGMVFSGLSPDKELVEIAELSDHPFMLGSQFHPEFISRPNRPHPLFTAFVKASAKLRPSPSQPKR